MAKAKYGAGAMGAFLRQGLKELSQVLPAFRDSVQVVEEPGAPGNLTNIEVLRGKESAQEAKGKDARKALEMEMGQ